MEIYLFRHGIAEDAGPGTADAQRRLTGEGRQKTAEVLKLARRAEVKPSLILTSPYVRARQTAEIAAEELGYAGDLIGTESLVPHSSPERVWQEIRDHGGETAILLAGHEPLLSGLVAYLLNSPALRVEMKKAALVRIDAETVRAVPHGTLRWMIVPKMA